MWRRKDRLEKFVSSTPFGPRRTLPCHLSVTFTICLCVCTGMYSVGAQSAEAAPETLPSGAKVDAAGDPAYVEPFFSKEYGHLLIDDVKHVLTTPYRWETKQWLWAGGAVAG